MQNPKMPTQFPNQRQSIEPQGEPQQQQSDQQNLDVVQRLRKLIIEKNEQSKECLTKYGQYIARTGRQ